MKELKLPDKSRWNTLKDWNVWGFQSDTVILRLVWTQSRDPDAGDKDVIVAMTREQTKELSSELSVKAKPA